MTINLRNVLAYMKEDLRGWDKINFEFTTTNDDVTAKADITINSINANVMIIIKAYSGGGAVFRAVFDKIEKTPRILSLLNDFNRSSAFFKGFIRNDDYLELEHYFVCYEEGMFRDYCSEFLVRLSNAAKEEELRRLVDYTYS